MWAQNSGRDRPPWLPFLNNGRRLVSADKVENRAPPVWGTRGRKWRKSSLQGCTFAGAFSILLGCQSTSPQSAHSSPIASAAAELPRGSNGEDMQAPVLTLIGTILKKSTVGYRSPYWLEITDVETLQALAPLIGTNSDSPMTLELRGDRIRFDSFVGQSVTLQGEYVVEVSEEAVPGSEAASRFVDAKIPTRRYFMVSEIQQKNHFE